MKHTPGQWRAVFDAMHKRGVRNTDGFICFLPGVTHYTGQDARYEQELEEAKANQLLIAAAPELLEALEEITNQLDTYWDDDNISFPTDETEMMIENARAAIAKAKGEA